MHTRTERVEDRYIVLLIREKEKFYRTFGPMTRNQAASFRAYILRQERADRTTSGDLTVKCIQCWKVHYDNEEES